MSYATPSGGNRIEVCTRFVWQYYFYLRDRDWGRMFLRICPYFPFNVRVCVNQHEHLARQLEREGIPFRQSANAFVQCADPERLQQLADGFNSGDLDRPVQRWLHQLMWDCPGSRTKVACGCTNQAVAQAAALDSKSGEAESVAGCQVRSFQPIDVFLVEGTHEERPLDLV